MLLQAQKMGVLPPEVTSPLVSGRLGQLVDTWKMITNDPCALQAVKGFRIPLPFTQPEHMATEPCFLQSRQLK